jgi:hypothetical protein
LLPPDTPHVKVLYDLLVAQGKAKKAAQKLPLTGPCTIVYIAALAAPPTGRIMQKSVALEDGF